jgi:hypothetical protein
MPQAELPRTFGACQKNRAPKPLFFTLFIKSAPSSKKVQKNL